MLTAVFDEGYAIELKFDSMREGSVVVTAIEPSRVRGDILGMRDAVA